jgi:hypothetical protein
VSNFYDDLPPASGLAASAGTGVAPANLYDDISPPAPPPAAMSAPASADSMRDGYGMYHFVDPTTGAETYSQHAPPPGAKPYTVSPLSSDPLENFEAGMGKAFIDTGRGARQIWAGIADRVAPEPRSLSDLITDDGKTRSGTRSAAIQREIDDAQALDSPLMHSGAGIAGNIAGYVAPLAPFAPAGVAGAAALGATEGLVQPVQTGGSRSFNTVAGGALGGTGQLLAKAMGRLAQPVKNALTPEEASQVQLLEGQGVPLNVGQRTGSPIVSRMISAMGDNPATVGAYTASREAQQKGFNAAVLRNFTLAHPVAAGADAATPDVMQGVRDGVGDVFNDVGARTDIGFDSQLAGDLHGVLQDASLNEAGETLVNRTLARLARATDPNGVIDSNEYLKTYSALGGQARSQEVGTYATRMRDALRGALQRSASPGDADLVDRARTEWQMMKQTEGAVTDSGDISPRKLASAMRSVRNRSQSIYGYGNQDLAGLAKAGSAVLPDALANSGTPARAEMAAAPLVHMEALLHATKGEFGKAAALEGGAFLLPKAGTPLLGNGAFADYLVNGTQNAMARALLKAGGSAPSRMALSQIPQRRVLQGAADAPVPAGGQ